MARDENPSWTVRVRTEAWDGPRGRRLLVLADDGEDCACLLVAHDPDTRMWSQGLGRFAHEAMGCAREGFEERLAMGPAHRNLLAAMGMLVPMRGQLAGMLGRRRRMFFRDGTDRGPGTDMALACLWRLGYRDLPQSHGLMCDAMDAPFLPTPDAGDRDMPATVTLRLGVGAKGDGRVEANTLASGALDAWAEVAAGWLHPPGLSFVPHSSWTPEIHAYFTAPGHVGTYRRQAGALYPLLVPAFATNPDLSALVDAGRPFERLACALLDRGFERGPGEALTPAKLRRLRGPGPSHPLTVADLLRLAGRISLDRFDLVTGGRPEFPMRHNDLKALERWADGNRLDLATLVRRCPAGRDGMRRTITPATDLARRLAATLAVPLLHPSRYPDMLRAVVHVLYDGLDLNGIKALSERWHSRLRTFEAALPIGRDLSTWPALFEPFEHGEVLVRCLVLPSELRAEGAHGPDRDGIDGLGHCVGGFAPLCHCGHSHVASVRTTRDGKPVRLSTIELTADTDGRISVLQHHGLRNEDPGPMATDAVGALLDAIARGRLALSPEALQHRDPNGFDDGIAWETPDALARSWAAWRPFLPRRLAAMGPEGFRALLTETIGALAMGDEGGTHGNAAA